MYETNKKTFIDKHLVKFKSLTEHENVVVLHFETLSGVYLAGLNCYCRSNDFWLELCGTKDPSHEKIRDVLQEPMLATVEKLDVGEDRPKLIHITKLEPIQ